MLALTPVARVGVRELNSRFLEGRSKSDLSRDSDREVPVVISRLINVVTQS